MGVGVASRYTVFRTLKGGTALALLASLVITPVALVLDAAPAAASPSTTYTPATPTLATLTSPAGCAGSACAPWNEYQGDSASPAYASQSPGTVLPVYTPGGSTTSTANGTYVSGTSGPQNTVTAPNLSIVPSIAGQAKNGDGVAPYPSGVVGTPGPMDGYCGSGDNPTESGQPTSRQPAGTTLPLAPSYFPHVIRNADGSLTGYFDTRPKDADESLMAATSTDNGRNWTYDGQALEQNQGYCPTGDINDAGQGHANVITVGGNKFLYTLPRASGDMQGVGMVVHHFSPTAANPLNGLPSAEPTGIDPDGFATAQVSVPTSGGVSLPLTTTGSANSPEQLVTGDFVDLTQDPTPVPAEVISCTVTTGSNTMTACTSPTAITVNVGDLIEQVIGYLSAQTGSSMPLIPKGPNTTMGDGGVGTLDVSPTAAAAVLTSGSSNLGFTLPLTGSTYNNDAPNRVYFNGTTAYCAQANNNPTTKIENCTTGPNGSSFQTAVAQIITSDPIIPATAYQSDPAAGGMTSGLVAPDGIVGTLPTFPNDGSVPAGASYFMYTEKELSYYLTGDSTSAIGSTGSHPAGWGAGAQSISFIASPYIAQNMPAPSSVTPSSPVTVTIGLTLDTNTSTTAMVPVTCTALTEAGASSSLGGCTVPSAYTAYTEATKTFIGAPGATTVALATLQQTGEGSASNAVKLYKNNQDLTVLRVAWTTNGYTFSTSGLTNGGIISDCVTSTGAVETTGCTPPSSYTGINDPATSVSPSNLNQYATNEGTPGASSGTDIGSTAGGDIDELRWVGSAGSIVTNPDGTYGLFLSGAWAADGDSDAFNQIFYSSSSDGLDWSVPTPVISTDYTFSASYNQDNNVGGTNQPIGISAYYEGRAYGSSVVQNPDGTLTMVFAGYRFPKSIATAGDVLGTASPQWTVGPNDPTLYRNILTTTLTRSTSPAVATTTTLSVPPASPAVVGQTESVSATVAPVAPGTGTPTGTVTFEGTGGTLCTGTLDDQTPDTASCTYSYGGPTTDSVTANYGGDSNYAVSAASPADVTVNPDVTTTSTPSVTDTTSGDPADPAVVGEQITLSSTVAVSSPGVGTATGTVTFADGGGTLCTGSLDAQSTDTASCTYTFTGTNPGDSITASYGGDTNDESSQSAALDEVVAVDPTSTALTISPSGPVVGQPVTLSATVSANAPGSGTPSGTVRFTGDGGPLCSAALDGSSPDVASCTTTYPAVASDDVTASYPGDAGFAASSDSSTVTVGQASTSTAISASTATPVVGQPVTYTATVTVDPPGSGTPTGTVTFTGNGGTLCSGPVTVSATTPDTATCTVAYTSPGSDTVGAAYSGDPAAFTEGSSDTTSVTIAQDATTTSVTSSPSTPVVGQPVTYTATVSANSPGSGTPTGTVAFTDGGGTLCGAATLSGTSTDTATCTTTYTSPTTDTVTAAYGGDPNDQASSADTAATIGPDATSTTVTVPSSVVVGQTVTLSATVAVSSPGAGTPTGTVTFTGNGGTACTGTLSAGDPDTASCTTSYPDSGPGTVTATYNGDGNDTTSTGSAPIAVGAAATATVVQSTPSSPVPGQSVELTATVSVESPGSGTAIGTVTFSDAGGILCAASLDGSSPDTASCATSYPGPTTDTVTATYGGDADFDGSSGTTSVTVVPGSTTTVLASSANPSVSGQPLTFSASVAPVAPATGSPTGTVTFAFRDAAPRLGPLGCVGGDAQPLSGGTATCVVPNGALAMQSPVRVSAVYGGSTTLQGSSSHLSNIVDRASSSMTIHSTANPSTTGKAVNFSAIVGAVSPGGGVPTGTVTWTVASATGTVVPCASGSSKIAASGRTTCDVAAGELLAADGPYTVSVSYPGDANYTASTWSYAQDVSKAGTKVTLSVSPPSSSGHPGSVTASVGSQAGAVTPSGTVTFTITANNGATVACDGGNAVTLSGGQATCTVSSALVHAGSPYTVTAAYGGDANFTSSVSKPAVVRVHAG